MRLPLAALLALASLTTSCAAEPPPNFASAQSGGVVTGPQNYSGAAGRPQVANDGLFDAYAWAYLRTPLLIRLAQVQTINAVEVVLFHEQEAWYQFVVEVSEDGKTWRKVAERTEGTPRGFQSVTFPATQCREIRVTFTATSIEAQSYHVLEVGAFLLPDPRQFSPLHDAYDKWKREGPPDHYQAFLNYLGPNAVMSPEQRAKVLALPAGQRSVTDLDADGDPDASDFVDTDPKHTLRPMLVRALDDDDDMPADGRPDLDSDLYVADWRGDGRIDAAVDYWDEDGDDDLDRMDIYYAAHVGWHVPKLEVVVIRDIGDDNLTWHHRNFVYDQYTCQWLSDFNGDDDFCMFFYDEKARRFVPFAECPFTHHDLDGDGVAELTMQFLGNGPTITSLRYSYDADNDSHPRRNRRDYDFSLNCLGSLPVTPENSTVANLRTGETTLPYLDWQHAKAAAEQAAWKSCRLCWDEVDNNVNPADKIERVQERWEGVGGYPTNEGNKRWETDKDFSGKMQLYWWSFDRRLHLLGAESGFINVDYNHDYKWDAKITYADEDGDGYFDAWSYDLGADGTVEHEVKGISPGGESRVCASSSARDPRPATTTLVPLPFDYPSFVQTYRHRVQQATQDNDMLVASLRNLLRPDLKDPPGSRIWQWWETERPKSFYAPQKLWSSAECRRYYLDLAREELFIGARDKCKGRPYWPRFEAAYNTGDFMGAVHVLSTRSDL